MTRCVDNFVEKCIDIPLQITKESASEVEATECATKVKEVMITIVFIVIIIIIMKTMCFLIMIMMFLGVCP